MKLDLQDAVAAWIDTAFGTPKGGTELETRLRRFAEEAAELCQALGMPKEEFLREASYVWDHKEKGDPFQEIGGVMLTLMALANVSMYRVDHAAEKEFLRALRKIDHIREKNRVKESRFHDYPETLAQLQAQSLATVKPSSTPAKTGRCDNYPCDFTCHRRGYCQYE